MSGKLCDGLELGPLPLLCVLLRVRVRVGVRSCVGISLSPSMAHHNWFSATVLIADRECLGWLFPRVQIYHLSI